MTVPTSMGLSLSAIAAAVYLHLHVSVPEDSEIDPGGLRDRFLFVVVDQLNVIASRLAIAWGANTVRIVRPAVPQILPLMMS